VSRSSFSAVALAVAWRALHNAVTRPALILPSIIFPLFFLVAFAGGLSRVGDVPGFDFPGGYTAFVFVWIVLQSCAFTGAFMGFNIAADFESGFSRRLLLAAADRRGIVAGYVITGLVRSTFTALLLFVAALVSGMRLEGSLLDLLGLLALSWLANVVGTLFALGVALRMRSVQAGPLLQTPIFLLMFLAPVWVPLDLLSGFVGAVAGFNPITFAVEAGRSLIAGSATGLPLGYGLLALMALVLTGWALTGLRRAEAAG